MLQRPLPSFPWASIRWRIWKKTDFGLNGTVFWKSDHLKNIIKLPFQWYAQIWGEFFHIYLGRPSWIKDSCENEWRLLTNNRHPSKIPWRSAQWCTARQTSNCWWGPIWTPEQLLLWRRTRSIRVRRSSADFGDWRSRSGFRRCQVSEYFWIGRIYLALKRVNS